MAWNTNEQEYDFSKKRERPIMREWLAKIRISLKEIAVYILHHNHSPDLQAPAESPTKGERATRETIG